MIFRIAVGIICVIACLGAWAGIFKLVANGYGWHLLATVLTVVALFLAAEKNLIADAPDDD